MDTGCFNLTKIYRFQTYFVQKINYASFKIGVEMIFFL